MSAPEEVVAEMRDAEIERTATPAKGARFYRVGEQVMFEFGIDGTNRIGPRPARKADKAEHPGAWSRFAEGNTGATLPDPSSRRKVKDVPAHNRSKDL